MKDLLPSFGLDVGMMTAGLFGALMSLRKKERRGFWTTVMHVTSGALSAAYLTPLVTHYFNFSQESKFGVAFLMGYIGLRAVDLLVLRIAKAKAKDEQ